MGFIKRRLFNWLMSHLFNAVTEDQFLRYDKAHGVFYFDGAQVSPQQVKAYGEQARAIRQLPIWNLLMKEMMFTANKKMYLDGTKDDDMVAGKWMLHTIDVLDQKLQNLSQIK
jgi:hypothetical protein